MPSIVRLKDFQVFNGDEDNPLLNVYHFECSENTPTATQLDEFEAEWNTNVRSTILDIVSDMLFFTRAVVEVLQTGVYFEQVRTGTEGTRTGNPFPIFVQAKFRYVRRSTTRRHGAKRYGGICEDDFAFDGTTSIGANIDLVEAALASTIQITGPVDFKPVVYSATPETYYEPLQVVYQGLGTQNTRKR